MRSIWSVRLIVGFAQALEHRAVVRPRPRSWPRSFTRSTSGTARSGWRISVEAFGDQYTEAERDRIVRAVYLHFCMMLMEILHIPRKLHPTTWRDRITLVGHERIVDRLLKGGPLIMLTGHFGNWEMAGYLFGVFGFPPNSVARTLDNPYLDRYLRSFRETDRAEDDRQERRLRRDARGTPDGGRPVVPGRSGRWRARDVRRLSSADRPRPIRPSP